MRFVTIDASPASRSATPTRSIPSATCCSAADRRPCAIAKMPATSTQYSTKGRRVEQAEFNQETKEAEAGLHERTKAPGPASGARSGHGGGEVQVACLLGSPHLPQRSCRERLGCLDPAPRGRMIDTVHRVSSGVKDRGNNLKGRKPRGQRRRDLGQHCGGHQEEHQRRNPRHLRKGPHVDAIAPHEPLADRPAVTRAVVLLKLRERTPLEPGQEHVRLYRKT